MEINSLHLINWGIKYLVFDNDNLLCDKHKDQIVQKFTLNFNVHVLMTCPIKFETDFIPAHKPSH